MVTGSRPLRGRTAASRSLTHLHIVTYERARVCNKVALREQKAARFYRRSELESQSDSFTAGTSIFKDRFADECVSILHGCVVFYSFFFFFFNMVNWQETRIEINPLWWRKRQRQTFCVSLWILLTSEFEGFRNFIFTSSNLRGKGSIYWQWFTGSWRIANDAMKIKINILVTDVNFIVMRLLLCHLQMEKLITRLFKL